MNIIEKYNFGRIKISGESYSSDLIVFPDEIKKKWWRKEGHSLCIEDLVELEGKQIDVLVVGTGAQNKMKVPTDVIQELNRKDIAVIVKKSSKAVEEYNKLVKENKKVAAALHLTC
ncbi:MAG: Mth938-like domain-containing protein [Candidatus Heimdallarchaeota archaeon]|nr:Mth938-like domain-containing protein [Candidatus Heimdallarchaeota archaeon]MCK4955536.1 Mth938-like domain-containing protein [Candidatus Heimdallarchaeota archaeon]